MAKRDEVSTALAALNGGNPGDSEHVAFFAIALLNQCQRRRQHADAAPCHGNAPGLCFIANIDHMGLSAGVKMGELRHDGAGSGTVNLLENAVIIATMKLVYISVVAVMALFFVPTSPADGLPDLGDVSATVLSPLDEKKIADQIMRSVMASDDVERDPEIQDYVQQLGMRLVAASSDKLLPFKFFVVKDNSINAFAMPGGVVGVHTGLIVAAENESEVAGVLGHEIGHVVQRHLARMMAQQKRDSIISMATIGLALLAARANPQLASGAMVSASAGSLQKQLDYTREHEREADRVGLQIMADAGFDTRGMPAFFEILQRGTRFIDGSAPSFLRTHPLTTERIADVRSRVEQGAYRQVQDSAEFQYVRAKLLANLGPARQAMELFRNNLAQRMYTNEAAQHYGLAIASLRANDVKTSANELAWLNQNASPHAMFASLAANIEVAKQNTAGATRLFQQGLEHYPRSRALIFGYAEHLLRLGKTDAALELVAQNIDLYPDDPYFYELRAKAYTMQGKRLLRHQAQGEAYVRSYNVPRAIEQMDLAAKAGDGDFYQQSIVEARLKQLRLLLNDPKDRG